VEGLAHVSEIQRDGKVKLDRLFKPGDALRARVIKIDPGERKIGLTTRDVEPLTEEEKAQHAVPQHHEATAETPAEKPAESEPAAPEKDTNSQS